jgi:thiol:disulfide interchange protein DsbD
MTVYTYSHDGFWLLVGSSFGFGRLLSLTPCVFPMIPILSSIIVGSGRDGHALSLACVRGMAVTYAAAGIAAGLTGTLLAVAQQNPWVLGSFAVVFVLLSLSMFGVYELQLPTFLQNEFLALLARLN